ncbi:MAG: HAD-IA family hydrolase [Candidatus Eisenbacteria bacterium]
MTPERPEAVLLDLDDTLFDHRRSARGAVEAIRQVEPALAATPLDDVLHANREVLEEIHLRVLAGEIDVDEAREERMFRLLERFRGGATREDAVRLASHYREAYQAVREVVPGSHALLEELRRRNYRLAVVTNNMTAEQEEKMRTLRLSSLVDELVVSEAVGVSKPEPGIFRIALEWLGVRPECAVMVGDSWVSDIAGAARAQVAAVWYNPLHAAIPDPSLPLAAEIHALEPTTQVADTIQRALGR